MELATQGQVNLFPCWSQDQCKTNCDFELGGPGTGGFVGWRCNMETQDYYNVSLHILRSLADANGNPIPCVGKKAVDPVD